MKRPKISEHAQALPALSDELYQNVIAIDKSHEDPTKLLDPVLLLLGLCIEDLDTGRDPPSSGRPIFTPKIQWALRWCLSKLAGDDEGARSFRRNAVAWRLLRHLVAVVPQNTVTSLMISHRFPNTVKQTLSSLRSETDTTATESSHETPGKSRTCRLSEFVDLDDVKRNDTSSNSKSKKRKRSEESTSTDRSSVFQLFAVITDVLQSLCARSGSFNVSSFGRLAQMEIAFRVDIEWASYLLDDSLAIVSQLMRRYAATTEHVHIDLDLLGPYSNIWGSAAARNAAGDGKSAELYFLQNALVSCLAVVSSIGGTANGTTSVLSGHLDDLLAHYLILPFRRSFNDMHRPIKDMAERAKANHSNIRDAFLSHQSKSGNPNDAVVPPAPRSLSDIGSALPYIFKLAFRCCRRNTISQRTREDQWLQSFFSIIAAKMDFDIENETGQVQTASRDQLNTNLLTSMIEIAITLELKLATTATEGIITNYSGLKDGDHVHWDLVRACLTINPTTVLPSMDSLHPQMATNIFRRLSEISKLRQEAESGSQQHLDQPSCNGADTKSIQTYEDVFTNTVLPLIAIFSDGRALPSFINNWWRELEHCLKSDKKLRRYIDQVLPWTDERLVDMMSSLISELPPAQQVQILQKYTKISDYEELEGSSLSAIIVSDCIINGLSLSMQGTEIVSTVAAFFNNVAQLDSKAHSSLVPKCQDWRLWRVLSLSVEFVCLGISNTDSLPNLENLVEVACEIITKAFKHAELTISDMKRALFCVRFVISSGQVGITGSEKIREHVSQVMQKALKYTRKSDGSIAPVSVRELSSYSKETVNTNSLRHAVVLSILFSDLSLSLERDVIQQISNYLLSSVKQGSGTTADTLSFSHWTMSRLLADERLKDDVKLGNNVRSTIVRHLTELCAEPYDSDELYAIMDAFGRSGLSILGSKNRKALSAALKHVLSTLDEASTAGKERHLVLAALARSLEGDATYKHKVQPDNTDGSVSKSLAERIQVLKKRVETLRNNLQTAVSHHLAVAKEDLELLRSLGTGSQLQESEAGELLSQLFHAITSRLQLATSLETFILDARTCTLLLSRHAWAISQAHIDSILSAVIHQTSSRSGLSSAGKLSPVYICLTRLLGSVLSSHRAKVGGRYHLLVPALQGLLRCLFLPSGPQSTRSSLDRPPWCSNGEEDGKDGGDDSGKCADALTRLLTSICDPTVSAARSVAGGRKGPQQQLNDPTKKARSLAGQSLQFVLVEFCTCQLRGGGRLAAAARTRLEPGLYSILGAMNRDAVAGMNAGMNAPQRAIFRALYEDWRRFGR